MQTKIALCIISILCFQQPMCADNGVPPLQEHALDQTSCEESISTDDLFDNATQQLQKITSVLDYYGQLLAHTIVRPQDSERSRNRIIQLKNDIEQHHRSICVNRQSTNIGQLVALNKALIEYIEYSIEQGFDQGTPFSLESAVTRSLHTVSSEVLNEQITYNADTLEKLQKNLNEYGFTRVQKVVRWLDTQNERHKIINRSCKIGLASMGLALGIYLIPKEKVTYAAHTIGGPMGKFLSSIKSFVGTRRIVNNVTGKIEAA